MIGPCAGRADCKWPVGVAFPVELTRKCFNFVTEGKVRRDCYED